MPTDPDSVETCYCATAVPLLMHTRTAYETGKEPAMQCAESRCCVQCSLPCVGMWGLGSEAFASVAADDGDIAP